MKAQANASVIQDFPLMQMAYAQKPAQELTKFFIQKARPVDAMKDWGGLMVFVKSARMATSIPNKIVW